MGGAPAKQHTHAANQPVIVALWGRRRLLGCVRCVTQSQETHCVTDFFSRVTGYLYVVNERQGNEAWLACSQQTVWSASSKLGLEWKRMAQWDGRGSGPSLVYKPKLFRWHLKRLLLNSERQPGEDVRCGPFRGNSRTNIDICTSQKVTLLFWHIQLGQVILLLLIALGTYKQKEILHLLFCSIESLESLVQCHSAKGMCIWPSLPLRALCRASASARPNVFAMCAREWTPPPPPPPPICMTPTGPHSALHAE